MASSQNPNRLITPAAFVPVVLEDLSKRRVEYQVPVTANRITVDIGSIGALEFRKTTDTTPNGRPIFRQVGAPEPAATIVQ